MENIEDKDNEQISTRWFIDLDWYQQNSRSFFVQTQNCLCPKCTERLLKSKHGADVARIIASIKDCCSKTPGFITPNLPILESIFRIFLANGNQPLTLEELGEQLMEWRGGYIHGTSSEILSRLLINNQFYGLCQAPDQP